MRAASSCRTTCSSRTRLGACRRTCTSSQAGRRTVAKPADPMGCHAAVTGSRLSAGQPRQHDRRPAGLCLDGSDLASAPLPRQLGLLRRQGLPARLCRQRDVMPASSKARRRARDLEPPALLRHRAPGSPTREHPALEKVLRGSESRQPAVRSPGSRLPRRSATIRPRWSPSQAGLRHPPDQHDHAWPRLELDPRSSSPGPTGAASTTTSTHPSSTTKAADCACPAS